MKLWPFTRPEQVSASEAGEILAARRRAMLCAQREFELAKARQMRAELGLGDKVRLGLMQ